MMAGLGVEIDEENECGSPSTDINEKGEGKTRCQIESKPHRKQQT